MIEIFRRPQHHTKANIQYNFIIQKTFKVCILSCQRASVPFSTGPGGKELNLLRLCCVHCSALCLASKINPNIDLINRALSF